MEYLDFRYHHRDPKYYLTRELGHFSHSYGLVRISIIVINIAIIIQYNRYMLFNHLTIGGCFHLRRRGTRPPFDYDDIQSLLMHLNLHLCHPKTIINGINCFSIPPIILPLPSKTNGLKFIASSRLPWNLVAILWLYLIYTKLFNGDAPIYSFFGMNNKYVYLTLRLLANLQKKTTYKFKSTIITFTTTKANDLFFFKLQVQG